MKPQNKLREAMIGVQGRTETLNAPQPQPYVVPTPRSTARSGRRSVQGFVTPEAFRQLHLIGVDKDCSIQDLVIEALNDLFRKYDKSAIA